MTWRRCVVVACFVPMALMIRAVMAQHDLEWWCGFIVFLWPPIAGTIALTLAVVGLLLIRDAGWWKK